MKGYTNFAGRKDIVWVVVLFIIVLLPNSYLALYRGDFPGSFFKPFTYWAISVLLFLLPSLFLKAKAFFLAEGLLVILAPFEIAHVYMNKMPVTTGFVLSLFDTNTEETFEVISSMHIPILLYLTLCIFYFYIAIKKIENTYFITKQKVRRYCLGISLGILLIAYSVYYIKIYRTEPEKKAVWAKTNQLVAKQVKKIFPCDVFVIFYETYALRKEIQDGSKILQNFRFDAKKSCPVDEKEIYVFIIGETARYSSFSINGYPRETSPLLAQTTNLISYSDFFSEANYTRLSLPTILTRSSPLNNHLHNREKSFVDAFQEAGFSTYWIANQSAANNFIRRISKDATGEYFAASESDSDDNFDELLWDSFDEVLAKDEKKVLIVMHTLGSHFRYNFRYPESFNRFQPSFDGSFDYALISSKNKEKFINTYDNSILYTDYFLANTIKKIDSLGRISSLVYVSDHGENLFDTADNIVLHGASFYTQYDFHVPFFVWTSDQYNRQYPGKVENMINNKDKKLSASNIFYSILDIADISFPEQVLKKSIASDVLQPDSVRYIIDPDMDAKAICW